ncbi:hypothetical protein E2P60_04625 [Candidatus Bathyarchaeota archaeon]|nr:hypothetical protein E2P60_04625 [Candidatus Bathyarchaeota archaeon]
MSELSYPVEVVTQAAVTSKIENIPPRKTVVYRTLIDSAVVRINGEKNKHKLFKRFLFLRRPAEDIEFVSIEKYYEPYIIISGRYLIDYYRKESYSVTVDKAVKEVVLFNRTFIPGQSSVSFASYATIRFEGEERLVKQIRSLILLNKDGQDLKINEFESAPAEENPQKILKSFKTAKVAPEVDMKVIYTRIKQRPNDIHRIVNEELKIDERSVIYTPRFRITYRCPKINKEAYLEFDGVTSKQVKNKTSGFTTRTKSIRSTE